MACAANYAWANRQVMTALAKRAVAKVLGGTEQSLGLRLVYDVCHNIAKLEQHEVAGRRKTLCVHRKGATRAFPPGHDDVPSAYRSVGQPVLVPGDMGTCSYVLVGTEKAMEEMTDAEVAQYNQERRLDNMEARTWLDQRAGTAKLALGLVDRYAADYSTEGAEITPRQLFEYMKEKIVADPEVAARSLAYDHSLKGAKVEGAKDALKKVVPAKNPATVLKSGGRPAVGAQRYKNESDALQGGIGILEGMRRAAAGR